MRAALYNVQKNVELAELATPQAGEKKSIINNFQTKLKHS